MSASRSATSSGAIASRMFEARQDRRLHVRLLNLLEGICRFFVAQGGEDRVPIVWAEFVDDVGDVGRVQLGQLGGGGPGSRPVSTRNEGATPPPRISFLGPIQKGGGGPPAGRALRARRAGPARG